MQQSKMSVAARRRTIIYIVEQAIMLCIMCAGFCGFLIVMRTLLSLA